MMPRRPRCAHCTKVLMLGEDWFEATPRVFYCEKDKRLAAPVETIELPVDFGGAALMSALVD
jgi:hypothetical protein